jgi:ketosteroid isomerase-like protein
MTDRIGLANAVADFYEARENLDLERSMNFFADKCHFQIVGTDKLAPFTQITHTRADLDAMARGLFENWDLKGLKTVNAYFDGDVALVHRAGNVLHRPSGTSFHTEMMDKLTFSDGKIVEYLQFLDTYQIAKVAGAIPD